IFPYTLCALVALLMFSCEPLIKPQHHFSVLFDANGGDGDMDAQILAEGVIDHLAENNFQREGYTFVGWNTAPDGSGTSYDDADLFKTDQNLTLYAQWEKLLFPLFFEANGGSGNMSAQMIKYDESTALNENTFIRGGYRFTGWNTEADGSGKAYKDKQEIVITQESYLYAQWTMLSSGTENGHSYIDLGLPSGLKWASFNLGAKTPEGSGDYFAWGETEPKKEYSWESYKWSSYSDGAYKMTKYNTDIQYGSVVDNKESLEIEDDAAHVNWQGKWRMPTSVEYAELINYCTWTWASQNGISGFIVKSEVNDNSIFLPAAGWYVKSGCEYISKWGFYWLNNLTPGISPLHAYYWKFYSELYKQPYDHIDYVSRYYGMPIRPVYAEFAIVTFNANGGQGEMPAQQFAIGESQALMSNAFTRAGYNFTGWNTAPDGSGTAYYNHQIISPEQNLTLYAQWEEDQVISGSENGYDYVDLGLPSGTKWATCNVGATTPEGYGDYFAWGETEPKSEYEWSTYKYSEGSSSLLTKYNNAASDGVVDNISTLAHYDDAARVNWGGKWRMPSSYEIDELIKNCTWTVFEKNGINGYKATSKINGNSIFFPTAGVFSELDVYNAGSIGYYWSRSLASNYQYMALYLSMRLNGNVERTPDVRYRGRSVRAVFAENDKPSTFVTLSFDANGGEGTMAAQTFEAGVSQAVAANAFTRSGYNFTGWNTSPDGSGTSYTDKQSITLTQDVTLYAQWERIKYNLSFDANGGSGTMAAQTFEAGVSQAIVSNTFTRSGYTFAGWNTNADGSGTSYTNKQIITLTQDITLYAQWERIKYNLSFDANGGSGTMAAQTFEAGVSQVLAANTFTRSGYTFIGWNTSPDGSGTSYTNKQIITLTQDLTLYAQWQVVSGTENGHDYVDLGLPSGLKWATCNIGATSPEDYGDYFAWGETTLKDNYDWSTYKYCNGSVSTLTKYNGNGDYGTIDYKTTLDLSDDAARANWGGAWRMPTYAELDELRNNCTRTWTTQNGVNGYKVTSKTNGNSIFLPAAGSRYGTSVYDVGSRGYYWSSSLYEGYPCSAYSLRFNSGDVYWINYYRYYGYTVRAVCP
ncbi:MAG: InlB B-repeat-containing protein, partial [Bacteroidales bacterium]|nr:InlB B-repeat-containing protein [Bacteroidales bacterium]